MMKMKTSDEKALKLLMSTVMAMVVMIGENCKLDLKQLQMVLMLILTMTIMMWIQLKQQ
jgi:hypothetical protein